MLQGYVENRTKEVALFAMFAAMFLAIRPLKIPIFPTVTIHFGICFWAVSLLTLSYPFVWVFTAIESVFIIFGFGMFPPLLIGRSILYFLVKLVGIRKGMYLVFFGSIFSTITTFLSFVPLGIISWAIFIPTLIKATTQGVVAVITVPLLVKTLERTGAIEIK